MHIHHHTLAISTIALLGTLYGGPVSATDEALLQVLLANKLITQQQYDAIQKAEADKAVAMAPVVASAAPAKLPAADDSLLDVLLANGVITQAQFASLQLKNADTKLKTKDEAVVTLKDGFKVATRDQAYSVQVGGLIQADSAWYGGQHSTDFSNGTELRRGRLSLTGTVMTDWDFRLETDFAGTTQGGATNTVTVQDAYVRYTGLRPVSITAGNFKPPFSLEALTRDTDGTFMERGLPFSLLNSRLLGAMVATGGDDWTAATGFFGDGVTAQNGDDEGYSATARVTFAPYLLPDEVIHVGLSGLVREVASKPAGNKRETVRLRAKPESNIISDNLTESASLTDAQGQFFGRSGGRLVDTGNIPGNVNYLAVGDAEAAFVYGPFSLQGEYSITNVDRDAGGTLSFDSFYMFGSVFLTPGDTRRYVGAKGNFDPVQPLRPFSLSSGGWGAWELAARFSGVDLNDENIQGGDLEDVTLGLNWYPNRYFRLAANYVNVLSVHGGAHDGENIDAVQVRAQVVY